MHHEINVISEVKLRDRPATDGDEVLGLCMVSGDLRRVYVETNTLRIIKTN